MRPTPLRPAAIVRAAGIIVLAAALVTCGEDGPSGPSGTPIFGSVVATPVFPSGQFTGPNLPIDHVHAIVVRPPSTTLKDTTSVFDPNREELQLRLPLLLRAAAESLDVTLELLSGTQVLFSGTSRLEARAGVPNGPPPAIPLIYGGPGAQLATLILDPRDSSVTEGDSLIMRVSGLDANQVAVPSFYVSWSSSDTTIARVNGAGVVRGRVPRGTAYIRARTPATQSNPNGVVDSTTVMLLPVPASLAKVGGDDQAGAVGTPLGQPLAVEVRASDNLPVPNVAVAFAVESGGGSVDSATATTDAQGIARTGATLGATQGTQTFSATVAGLAPVTFTATATAQPQPTWTGAVSTDWNTAGNWNLGAVPTGTDSVTIPAGPANQPVVNADVSTGPLVVNGTITLASGFSITANGSVAGTGSITGGGTTGGLTMPTSGSTLSLPAVSNLVVTGAVSLGQNVGVSGQVTVAGPAGNLSFGSHTATVGGDFSTTGSGILTMSNALDSLKVAGDITFGGGSTAGTLSAGVIFVGGDFTQTAATSARSYAPTGTHLLAFTGTGAQTVTFATPGASGSNLETLALANPSGNIQLGSDLYLTGPVGFAAGVPRIAHGNGHTLFVAELLASNATLDNLLVVASNVSITQFDSITFTNYSPAATPLTISHPGGPAPFVFHDLTFTVTPTSGFYMSVTDNSADANILTIEMVNPSPDSAVGLVQTAGGAVVNWPAAGAGGSVNVWTGAVSTDWSDPGNWSLGRVPLATDSVEVPAATNQPQLTGPALALAVHLAGGTLTLNGQSMAVLQSFVVTGAGRLVMTNPADGLSIGGDATFDGANELNSLSAGVILFQGDLTQLATNSPDSYHPSGTHQTVFAGANQTVSFATPGLVPGSSHLQEAVWTGAGNLILASDVFAHGTLLNTAATPGTLFGNGHTLTVGGYASGSALTTFDNLALVVNNTGSGQLLNINNLAFANMPATAVQLDISHSGQGGPFTLTGVTFSGTPSSGLYLRATDTNGNDGQPLTLDLVNPTPASDGGFIQTLGGAVINWPAAGGGGSLWTGAVSTDWNDPGNWSPAGVPNASTDVQIPGNASNQPVLTGAVTIRNLTTTSGGVLDLGGFDLTIGGDFSGTVTGTGGGTVVMSGASATATGFLPNLVVSGTVSLPSLLQIQGNLTVLGSGAHLVMNSAFSSVQVGGDAQFDGAASAGDMTNGQLLVNGDFQVGSSFSPTAFAATGNHTTVFLNGAGPQSITLANPGLNGNHFGQLSFMANGTYTVNTVSVESFLTAVGPGITITGSQGVVQTAVALLDQVTFDNVRLEIVNPGIQSGLGNVTFQNMDPTAIQLHIAMNGSPVTMSFSNMLFATTPTSGLYFSLDDTAPTNGVPLVVDMVNPSPASPGGFVSVSGGAVINWPAAGGGGNLITWTGASSSAWSDPGNWDLGRIPQDGDDVIIPAGTPNDPQTASSVTLNDLTIESGATLTNLDATVVVDGDLTGGGAVDGLGIQMGGTAGTIDMAQLSNLVIVGNVTLVSPLTVGPGDVLLFGSSAVLDLNGNDLDIGGSLQLGNGGRIAMLTPAVLSVAGDAVFDGGDEAGLLTAGTLRVGGDFQQLNSTTPRSFRANGLTVELNGSGGAQTVTMADSLQSFFDDLVLNNPAGISFDGLARTQGDVTVGTNTPVTSTDQSDLGGGLDVLGDLTSAPGSNLAMGRLYIVGNLNVGGAWNQTAVIFQGANQVAPILPYQEVFTQTANISFAPGAVSMTQLVVASGSLTLGGRTTVSGQVFVTGGNLKPNGHTLAMGSALNISGTGTLTMQNALDSVITGGTGAAIFGGGSTVGLLTDGVLKVGGSFSQTSTNSTTSFAASGNHKTVLGAAAVRVVNFSTPGTGNGGSHFGNLDVTAASGGLNLASDVVVDGNLIAQPTGAAPTLSGGKTLTTMGLDVTRGSGTSLILDNTSLVVNEQGTIRSQVFDRAQFQGFSASATLMDMTMVGASAATRQVTFNNVNFQTSVTNLYAKLVSSNTQGITVTMLGSNDPTGGPSRSSPPFGQTSNGATIVWQ